MKFLRHKQYNYLNSLTLNFKQPQYDAYFENETKPFTMSFVMLFLILSIILFTAFTFKYIIIGQYYKLLFFFLGILLSIFGIIGLKYLAKFKKIYIDLFLCFLVLSGFYCHTEIFIKRNLALNLSPYIVFYMGLGIQTFNILLFVSKINWILLLFSGFITFSTNLIKFLDDPDFLNGLWVTLTLPIILCFCLCICISYIKQKTEKIEFYERKKTEEQLKVYEKLIKEVIPNQIIIIDSKKPELIFKNKLASLLFKNQLNEKLILEELLNLKIKELDSKDEFQDFKVFYDNLINCKEKIEFKNYEANFPKSDLINTSMSSEQEINYYFTVKICEITWGERQAYLLILNDISSIRNLNKLKEIDEYKDILLATVSHDLRTPLSGITGMLDVISDQVKDRKIKQKIILAKKSSKILSYMINDILDFSQFSNQKLKLNFQSIPIEECLEEVIQITKFQAEKKNLEFILKIPNNLIKMKIIVDPIRLKQILFNLLTNAIKFTNIGNVTLQIKECELSNEIESIQFIVKDSGIGIKEENFDKIFTLFGKLKQVNPELNINGVGLGLVISNNIAKMMSEDKSGIILKSEFGLGSEFSFKIKKDLTSQKETELMDEEINSLDISDYDINRLIETSKILSNYKMPVINNIKILIVDDDAMNCIVHEKYLESFSLHFDTANNGAQAIEFIENSLKKNIFYSVIIMDCNMPVMNGFEASEKIREMIEFKIIPDVPIIAVTANASIQEINHCKKCGMKYFLPKPVSKNIMREKLKEILKLDI